MWPCADGSRSIATTIGAALAALGALARPVAAQDVGIELNRLESRASGCRVHLVLANDTPRAYSAYRLDLVVFGDDGVIARRVALEAAPLRANKTVVKEFELAGLDCARVGKMLLNDVSACESSAGERVGDCVAGVSVSSRAGAELVK